jgi:hypothetical protein
MPRFCALSRVPIIRRAVPFAFLGLLLIGCDAVHEDRHIEFSANGDQVAFQHGSDGIFVADPKTGELHKVFDPDPSVIAVSTPNWSDDETRAIFTTARDAARPDAESGNQTKSDGPSAVNTSAARVGATNWENAPTGRLFLAQPIVYTCWLIDRKPGGITKPVRLFDARCEHVGYVAANLAIRWDAKRNRVFFVERAAPLGHAVWIYDLESKRKTRLFPRDPQSAPAQVVFDLLGDGQHVVCVASEPDIAPAPNVASTPGRGEQKPATANGSKPSSSLSGIWFGSIEGTDWWHVPESGPSGQNLLPQGLSTLIAHRPVCSQDGRQFAFVGDEKLVLDNRFVTLFRARVADKKIERVFNTTGDIRDLRWSPDSSQLGFVLVKPQSSSFHILDTQGHVRKLFGDQSVQEFAGWNATGDKLACVVSEKVPPQGSQEWIDLLVPDPLARDAVLVADGKGTARTIASGLRFTFPQWSPKRDELSMWGTFQPSYLAITNEMGGGLGLRRGDPAAIVDVSTGSIRWLAINGDEMAQVGNYYLLKHDPAQAREWYRKADKQLPKLEPLRPDDLIQRLSNRAARRRTFEFFYSVCLSQLGESKEAAERLSLFDAAHRIDWPANLSASTVPETAPKKAGPVSSNFASSPAGSAGSRRESERLVGIAKALSIAQIFLSIDEPDAAQTWFSQRLAKAGPDEKLADVTALSQLCLLARQNREYATLATDQLAPFVITTLDDPPTGDNAQANSAPAVRTTLAVLAAHSLGPLFSEKFLKDLPPDFVGQLVSKWEALRPRSHGRLASLYVNLFLRAAAARLGHDKDRMAAKAEIAGNPFSAPGLLSGELELYLLWLRPPAQTQRPGQL